MHWTDVGLLTFKPCRRYIFSLLTIRDVFRIRSVRVCDRVLVYQPTFVDLQNAETNYLLRVFIADRNAPLPAYRKFIDALVDAHQITLRALHLAQGWARRIVQPPSSVWICDV